MVHFAILMICLGCQSVQGDALQGDQVRQQRTVYAARNGTAKDLASVLSEHFKTSAETRIIAEPTSNSLLITAVPTVTAEILKVLSQIDRRPQLVSIELIVGNYSRSDAESAKPLLGEAGHGYTGPISETNARIDKLLKDGRIRELKRCRFVTVENQPISLTFGESKPYISGQNVIQGKTLNTTSYLSLGATVDITARVADQQVLVEFKLNATSLFDSDDPVQIGSTENGGALNAPNTSIARSNSRLTIPSGNSVEAQDVVTRSKATHVGTLVIVSAQIIEPPGH